MTALFHARLYDKFIEIKSNFGKKKLYRTNEGSNFLGGSFSSGDNVRAPIQFRRERQSQHLKRWIFLKNSPIHFHISSTRVWTSQMKQAEFFQHWNQQATSCPSLQCLFGQLQVQKPTLVVVKNQMPDHT